MRIKTIFIIIVTILLTIIMMQNNQEVKFNILFSQFYISNLVVMAAMTVTGFILGLIVSRQRRIKIDDSQPSLNNPNGTKTSTLSDEDKDYIS